MARHLGNRSNSAFCHRRRSLLHRTSALQTEQHHDLCSVVWQQDRDAPNFGAEFAISSIRNFVCGFVAVYQLGGTGGLTI